MKEINKSEVTRHNRVAYRDIIDLPHHQSTKRDHMAIENRAAQFMPFAALTGFDSAVEETARLTQEKRILSPDQLEELDFTLNTCLKIQDKKPLIEIEFFVDDELKAGGHYESITASLKRIDINNGKIILEDNREIYIDNIYNIIIV